MKIELHKHMTYCWEKYSKLVSSVNGKTCLDVLKFSLDIRKNYTLTAAHLHLKCWSWTWHDNGVRKIVLGLNVQVILFTSDILHPLAIVSRPLRPNIHKLMLVTVLNSLLIRMARKFQYAVMQYFGQVHSKIAILNLFAQVLGSSKAKLKRMNLATFWI